MAALHGFNSMVLVS